MPGQNKAQVEQSLADLAIAEVGAKLPKLIEKLLGFQIVEINDEATRAAGILGYDVGESTILSPVLFLNGRIKAATDILYLADSDVFTSASPEWVEYLLSRAGGVTGQAAPLPAGAGTSPTGALGLFNRPPQIAGAAGKTAAAEFTTPKVWGKEWGSRSKWAQNLPCEFRDLFTWWTRPDAINAHAKTAAAERLTIPHALRSLGPRGYQHTIAQLTKHHPDLLEKFAQFHDLSELAISFSPEEIAADVAPTPKVAAVVVAPLTFVDANALFEYPDAFDAVQKTAVLEHGLAVIDKRAAHDRAEVFGDDYLGKFQSPTESGYHEIFNDAGKLSPVYVGLNPFLLDRPDKKLPVPMIIDAPGENAGGAVRDYHLPKDGDAILARSRLPIDEESFAERFAKLPKLDDVGKTECDTRYVAVSPTGTCSAPFEVRGTLRNQEGVTILSVHTDDDMERRLLVPPRGDEATGPDDVKMVRVVKSDSNRASIRVHGDSVFVPDTYRVIKVTKAKADDLKCRVRPGQPGLLMESTGRGMGMRTMEAKKEAAHSSKYILRQAVVGDRQTAAASRPLDKTAALKLLIGNLGFGETEARGLLDDTDANFAARRWFLPPAGVNNPHGKRAQLLPGTPFPADDEQGDTDEKGRRQQQGQWGTNEIAQDRLPVGGPEDEPDADGRDPAADALGSGFARTQRPDVERVMRAADGGQEVFDSAMMGMILKTKRTQAQIDAWVPDISSGLDRLCRLLLLQYWHSADVSASYGSDELAELESTLLGAIKIMGETVLFFKQKAAEDHGKKQDALGN